jgi:hypothetical protein
MGITWLQANREKRPLNFSKKLHRVAGYMAYFSNIRKFTIQFMNISEFVTILMHHTDRRCNTLSQAAAGLNTLLSY